MFKSNLLNVLAASILLSVLVWTAYSGAGSCEFVGFDDDLYVSENIYVREGLTLDSVKWAITATHASTWQPLVWLSYMIESEVQDHSMEPSLYHWTNVALHNVNVILLLLLLFYMTGRFWASFFVSMLFALHPIHVESVVWVAERKDVLSTFFWMLTLLLYAGYVRKPGVARYIGFTAAFIFGLMAKPMLVTLPMVMLILDLWPLKRADKGFKLLLKEKVPLLVPMALSTIITFIVQKKGGSVIDVEDLSIMARLLNVPKFYTLYIGKLLWPWPMALLYPHPGMPSTLSVIGSTSLLALATVLAWRKRKSMPWMAAGLAWFVLTLLPVIGILQFGLHGIADRFLYIPAIGLYAAFVLSLAEGVKKYPSLRYASAAAAAAAAVVMIFGSRGQVAYWKDNLTLFKRAVEVTENNWAMHNCLGAAYERKGLMDEAMSEFEIASLINPRRPRIFYNMGCVLHRKGRIRDAVDAYDKALNLDPEYVKVIYNRGVAMDQMKKSDEAKACYEKVIDLTGGDLMAYNNLGSIFVREGDLKKAEESYQKAVDLEPDYVNARYNLGEVKYALGDRQGAMLQFVEVLKRVPGHKDASARVVKITSELKRMDGNVRRLHNVSE